MHFLAGVKDPRHRTLMIGVSGIFNVLTLLKQAVTKVNETSPKVEKNNNPQTKQAIVSHRIQEGSPLPCVFSCNEHKPSTQPLFLC